ncbi:MAG: DUF488 family protein, partial [Bacteroidetes bacterium]|nr:DUF488 family protein [Bacteroidota bacterium]
LKQFDGELNRTRFYKLLFLLTVKERIPDFHFIPYNFGCYSFLAEKDLNVMRKYGYLENSNNPKLKSVPADSKVTDDILESIKTIKQNFGNYTAKELIRYIYNKYPYYALNSKIKDKFISDDLLKDFKPCDSKIIYSLGYEGRDIDTYLNILIKSHVTLLCDVRKNPLSMKFGFSKSQLKSYCEKLNIGYLHFPEFGIESVKRKNLQEPSDYKSLFVDYEKNVLPHKSAEIVNLIKVISTHNKIAFTCFESDPGMCHRSYLLNFVFRNYNPDYKLKHL